MHALVLEEHCLAEPTTALGAALIRETQPVVTAPHALPPTVLQIPQDSGSSVYLRSPMRMSPAAARSCRSVILDAKMLVGEALTAFCQTDKTLSEPVRTYRT